MPLDTVKGSISRIAVSAKHGFRERNLIGRLWDMAFNTPISFLADEGGDGYEDRNIPFALRSDFVDVGEGISKLLFRREEGWGDWNVLYQGKD